MNINKFFSLVSNLFRNKINNPKPENFKPVKVWGFSLYWNGKEIDNYYSKNLEIIYSHFAYRICRVLYDHDFNYDMVFLFMDNLKKDNYVLIGHHKFEIVEKGVEF